MKPSTTSQLTLRRDPVDELLKAGARELHDVYIDDAGFTLRVLDAMPFAVIGRSRAECDCQGFDRRFGLSLAFYQRTTTH